jgi:hypothetical protein
VRWKIGGAVVAAMVLAEVLLLAFVLVCYVASGACASS